MAKISIVAVGAVLALAGCTAPPDPGDPGAIDQQAPVIVSVVVTPQEVGQNEALQVAATVSDDVGVTGVAFVVRHAGVPAGFCSGSAELTSGTAQAGTWTVSCVTPAVMNSGEYQVNTLAVDARFNSQATGDGPPSATSGHFTVTGDLNDLVGPVVTSVTSAPNTVAPGGNLTITASVSDPAGVANVGFAVRRGGSAPGWCIAGAELISGTPEEGIWQLTCPVPADAEVGDYTVNTAAADTLNNITTIADDAANEISGTFSVG
ncbi:MAG: hypothetical protein WBF71_13100 [Microthrixaceae bacterium]